MVIQSACRFVRHRDLRYALAVGSAVLMVAVVAAGCSSGNNSGGTGGSGGSSSGTYSVGEEVELSGSSDSVGQPQDAGLRAAIDGINRRGGVNGHKITLTVRDAASDASTAVNSFTELTSRYNVIAVAGFIASVDVVAVEPLAKAKDIAMLTAGPPGNLLSPVSPVVFSTTASNNAQGFAQLDYMAGLVKAGKLPKNPRIAALYYTTPAGQSWISAVSAYAKEKYGWTLVAKEAAAPDAASLSTQMTAIAAAKADGLIMLDIEADAVNAAKESAAAGISPNIEVSDFAYSASPTAVTAVAAAGFKNFAASASYKVPADGTTGILGQFAADAAADHVDPNEIEVAEGYAQGLIIQNVLQRCGWPCSAQKFLATIDHTNTDLDGLAFGPIVYTSDSHYGVSAVRFRTVGADGKVTYAGNPVPLENG
jgi:branched-chain amino acid transport system substrate-binding protein